MFIDGFLGLLAAAGPGTATEITAFGYTRQAISFSEPASGVCFSATNYNFGQSVQAGAVGRAIYDAPTNGKLLLVLPFPVPLARSRLPWDAGEAGNLRLLFTAMLPYPRGAAFSGQFLAGSLIGLTSDAADVVNPVDTSQNAANPRPLITTASMTAGVALSIVRGVLAAA